MVAGVLSLALILAIGLLVMFIYQIVTTPLTAVDAPTLARSAAASASAAVLPAGSPGTASAAQSARRAAAPGASHTLPPGSTAALTVAGLAAVLIGGGLFIRIDRGSAACVHGAIEVCSQGFVLLTGTQLAGGAIAAAGIICLVVAIVLALRDPT